MRLKQPQHLNVVLGIWQLLSVFAWPHDAAQFTNTWLMGVLTVVAALVAMAAPGIRFVNTAAGVWLIISTIALPRSSAVTTWNNVLVGIAIVVVSLAAAAPRASARDLLARLSRPMPERGARYVNVSLGTWLFVSASCGRTRAISSRTPGSWGR